uniref:G_PROTEIN_RECEP_F1_2 domain-containing protein n=1 Tax=Caenorhabditis japonica TaxID=281687 RepID=A0A8R1HGT0_CAEJA
MAMSTSRLVSQIITATEIVFFNIFGVFGNVNFIVLTMKNKSLKSNSSYLQCALCFCHIICLLFELPNAGLSFSGVQWRRYECFSVISIYIFFICAQAVIIQMMTLDIFIIIYFPAFYRSIATWKYLTAMLVYPAIYSGIVVVWGFIAMDDELLMFCNPPLSLEPTVSRFWTLSNVIINTITLVMFLTLMVIFYYKGKQQKSNTKKVMQRLKVSILFFICTWYMGLLICDMSVAVGFTGETLILLLTHAVFFVLISYTQFFYVVIWRSPEYRNKFLEMWSFIPCCKRLRARFAETSKDFVTVFSQANSLTTKT